MMETLTKNRYLYYLQLGEHTSPSFIKLAQKFKQFDMEIIPIHYSEIDVFLQTGSENLLVFCHDFKQLQTLNHFSKKFLNYILSSGRVRLFLFSSFAMNEVLKKHEQRKKVIQYALPLSFNRIAGEIISQIFSTNKELNRWPGGKRSRIHHILSKPL